MGATPHLEKALGAGPLAERSESAEVAAVLEGAEACAQKAHAREVLPEHLLEALVLSRPGPLRALFERHKLTLAALQQALPADPTADSEAHAGNGVGPLPPSPDVAALLARARLRASGAKGPLGPGDLLVALAADGHTRASQVLARRFHLPLEALEKALASPKPSGEAEQEPPPHLAAASAGGVGLAAELRALESRIDALSLRERKILRRLSLLYFLVAILAMGLAAVNWLLFFHAPLPQ